MDRDPVAGADSLDRFVAARLAEDELHALEAGPDIWQRGDRWLATSAGSAWSAQRDDDVLVLRGSSTPEAVLAHVVRHDPERVLRDVTAKRRIHSAYRRARPGSANRLGLSIALRALACTWSDHPDFEAGWRA